ADFILSAYTQLLPQHINYPIMWQFHRSIFLTLPVSITNGYIRLFIPCIRELRKQIGSLGGCIDPISQPRKAEKITIQYPLDGPARMVYQAGVEPTFV